MSTALHIQLKNAIKKNNHTQYSVAKNLGIHPSTLCHILQGKNKFALARVKESVQEYISDTSKRIRLATSDFTKISYIRDTSYNPIGCMIAKLVKIGDTSMVAIGMSVCNSKYDTFNKKIGKFLAMDRADNYQEEYDIKRSNQLIFELYNFISQCKRYYKDKCIILPNINFV